MLGGQIKRIPVALGKQPWFTIIAAAPNWPYRVNDVLGLKAISASDLRLTYLATAKQSAFVDEIGSGSSVDRAVDSTTTEQ